MRIAITGGNGFLAGYCTDLFKQKGHEVFLITRKSGYYLQDEFITTDYSKESLKEILTKSSSDAVVHLAGPRKNYSSITDYNDYFDMTTAVFEAAAECGIRNIVFASSISVYSENELPYSETMVPNPANNYGLSKIIGEQIAGLYCRNQNLCIKSLRLAHLYGANEKNMYMINKFFRQGFNHEQIKVDCISVAEREMMYAKDAAHAILCALNVPFLSGVFNAGSNDNLTVEEIARKICSCMSPEMSVIVGDGKENIKSSYMNSEKAYSAMNFRAEYTLDTALPEIYDMMIEAEKGEK